MAGRMADQAASNNEVMTIYNKNNPLKVGDTVYISGRYLTIVGAFSEGMFPDDVTVICPQALFDHMVGAQNYNMIGVLLIDSATEQTVMQLPTLQQTRSLYRMLRGRNSQEAATYPASRIVVYGFPAIIGLISLLALVNSFNWGVLPVQSSMASCVQLEWMAVSLLGWLLRKPFYLCCFRADCRLYCRSAAEPYAVRSTHYTLFWHDMASARNDALPYHSIRICCRSSCGSCPSEADSKHGNY